MDANAVRAVAYALLMKSGYQVNHRPPSVYCLALREKGAESDPPAEAFPERPQGRDAPELKPVSQCPEGGLVLYTAELAWETDTRAVVHAGILRIHSTHYRTWKEKSDERTITIEHQPDKGWIPIDWKTLPGR